MLKFVDYLGDDRLRNKIVYDKYRYSECIYCGEKADSKEHIPSKVFLDKPYPDNLGIVPACQKCNKSFSRDELFLSILIERLKSRHYGSEYTLSEAAESRIRYNKKLVSDIERAVENNDIDEFDENIARIIFKLAIGHSVYEISEGYCIKDGKINYSFLNSMSVEEIDEFTLPFNVSEEPLPEMGSRVYERILIVEVNLKEIHSSGQIMSAPLVLLDWVDVQESKYSYTSYRFDDEIIVKMVINEYFYAKVTFELE